MYIVYVSFVYLLAFFKLVSLNPLGSNGDINKIEMPECCKNNSLNYCFSNESYPIEEVRKALSDLTNLSVDVEDNGYSSDQYSHRIGDTSNSCGDSKRQLIYYIVDKDDTVRVVVQLEKKFTQKFTIKTDCDLENDDIKKHFTRSIIKKHNLSFENKDMDFDVIVLNNKPNAKSKLEMIKVKLPVCCSCRYVKKY